RTPRCTLFPYTTLFRSLQNDVEARRDVLVYTSAPLHQSIELTGPVTAILYVAASTTNADFTAKLVDVHPDGRAFNVSDGILRRKDRKSTRLNSSHDQIS